MASSVRRGFTGKLFSLVFCLVLSVCCVQNLHAQTTATITGVVTDVQGAAVQGAVVVITNTATGISRTVTSDGGGRYSVGQLIPGPYRITSDAKGFKKTEIQNVQLDVAATLTENITAQVGGATETVDVTASTVQTQTESSEVGQVIDNAKVEELPLANRQFYNLAEIAPGVMPPAQGSTLGFRGGFNVNGAPETDNQFIVNGTFNNDMGTNQPSFRPSVETIGEFKVLSGIYSADYGRFAGGQIVMVTKQGTNKFHGNVYEFIRNGAVEAKPWIASGTEVNPAFKQNTFGFTVGGPILRDKAFFFFGYEGQRIRQQIVAGSIVPTSFALAGCLPAGATAISAPSNLSGDYNPLTGQAITAVPGTGQVGGYHNAINPATTGPCASAPGGLGVDITGLVDGNGANLFSQPQAVLGRQLASLAYPLPNIPSAIGANLVSPSTDYNFSETRRESSDAYNVRGDYKYSDKDSFSGTWNYFHDPSYEPMNSLCSSRTLPNFGCFTNQLSTLANVGEIHLFSSNLVNDVRFGFSRLVQPRIQEDNTTIGAQWAPLPGQLGQTAVPNNYGIPSLSVTNFTASGGQTNLPQDRWTNHFQFTDFVTWTHGAHTYKTGFDMTDVKSTEYEVTTGRGSLTFSNTSANTNNGSNHYGTTNYSLGDLLLGLPSSSSVTNSATPYTYNRFTSFDFFVMDDWKVTPYLTVNLGLRYELDNPVSEKNGQISTFAINAPNPYYIAGTWTNAAGNTGPISNPNGVFEVAANNGVKTVYQTDRNNFAPRLGFAWQPFKNEKTVVKGGVGTFYQEPILYNEFLSYSLQYPERYPKSFTSGAVNTAAKTAVGSPTTLLLNNPFNAADIPATPGGAYCPAGSTTTAGTCSGITTTGCAAPCSLTPVVSGTYIDPKYATPYYDEWSLSVQRQLNRSTVAEAGYYGSKGTRVSGSSVLNYNTLGTSTLATAVNQGLRVFPNYGSISDHKTGYNSEYNSFLSRLQESTKSGVTFLLTYTYSKSFDETTSAQNANPNYFDPINQSYGSQKGDRGISSFNAKHRIVFSPVVQLPFGPGKMFANQGLLAQIVGGFHVSGIYQYQSGRPFTVSDSSGTSGSNGGGDRPDVVSNPNAKIDHVTMAGTHNPSEWFDVHAFNYNPTSTLSAPMQTPVQINGVNAISATNARIAGTFGNEHPGAVIGPGLWQIDATIGRTFAIKEWAKLDFKLDGFNILNHVNYQQPGGSYTSGSSYTSGGFGVITAANSMRELQLSVHISF